MSDHKHSMTVFVEATLPVGTPVAMCGSCDLNLRGCYQIEQYIEHQSRRVTALVTALERYGTHNHRVVGSDPRQVFECSSALWGDCDCGFDDVLDSAKSVPR